MSHPLKVTFTDDADYALALAYAKDRGIPLATIARAALMAEVKRHVKRSGLLTALEGMVKEITQTAVENALVGRHPRGEEHLHTASTTHRWVGGERAPI